MRGGGLGQNQCRGEPRAPPPALRVCARRPIILRNMQSCRSHVKLPRSVLDARPPASFCGTCSPARVVCGAPMRA